MINNGIDILMLWLNVMGIPGPDRFLAAIRRVGPFPRQRDKHSI